jgi:hypothetical protein
MALQHRVAMDGDFRVLPTLPRQCPHPMPLIALVVLSMIHRGAHRQYDLHNARRYMQFLTRASVQLDLWPCAARDEPAERVQKYFASAMQGDLVHLVEGSIH